MISVVSILYYPQLGPKSTLQKRTAYFTIIFLDLDLKFIRKTKLQYYKILTYLPSQCCLQYT